MEPLEHYTVEDHARWEGDWELVRGQPLAMTPSPGIAHQRVRLRLARQLDEALDGCPRGLALEGTDWTVSADTVVRPDVMVVCGVEGERVTRTPALVIEVVSPESARRDERIKRTLYAEEGVAWYLLAYPDQRKLRIHALEAGRYRKVAETGNETWSTEIEGCRVTVEGGPIWPREG